MRRPVTAAEHLIEALKLVYADNSAPNLARYPSGGFVLATGEPDIFGNVLIDVPLEDWSSAASRIPARAPACTMRPGDRDPRFEEMAGGCGFLHAGAIPAMSVPLESVAEGPVPEGYRIERFRPGMDGQRWAEALSLGYPVAPMAARSMSPVCASIANDPYSPLQYFQACLDGEVVGVSLLVLVHGLAGIYCVATVPDHRRKGLGAALTAAPLLRARDLGYETGVLQASEMGYPTYRRLGFEDDGQVQIYLRTPLEAEECAR
ncbi:MAG: GNAT family N-acetyltransferase [Fimbriimonadaceae bacterium]|nr:GNAT family N-acetyltransferase [Fimbriimonadaceae bacterium]